MRWIVAAIILSGMAHAHLLESVPASVSVKFKNGHAASLEAKDGRLDSVEVTLGGTTISVKKEALADIPFPNLRSVHLLETDLDKVKKYFLSVRFGVEPDVHGSTTSDDDGHKVTFMFVDGRYVSRQVELAEGSSDPFGPPPVKPLPEK